jgi:hypothetical protein
LPLSRQAQTAPAEDFRLLRVDGVCLRLLDLRATAHQAGDGVSRISIRPALHAHQLYQSIGYIAKYTLDSLNLDNGLRMNLALAIVGVVLDRSALSILSRTLGLALFGGQPGKV